MNYSSDSSVSEKNQIEESDIDFIRNTLNIFGQQDSISQPDLATGNTIVPQRFANIGTQSSATGQQAGSQPTQQQQQVQPQPTQQQQQQKITMQQPVINISVKIPEPKAFHGDRKEARSWMSGLKRYFAACGWTTSTHDQQMHAVAQALMQGQASRWLDRLEKLNSLPNNFSQFVSSFLSHFCVLDDVNTARDKLKEAKQQGSVSKYIAYFDSIVLDLPNASEDDLIHNFCYGLKQPLKGMVKAQITGQSMTLSEVMTLALQYEESSKTGKTDHVPKQKQRPPSQPYNGPTPMELGNIDDDGKKKQIRCFNCNKLGHYARNCRSPKKHFKPNQQRINNMEEAADQSVPEIGTAQIPKN